MGNIPDSLFSEMLILRVILKLGMMLNLIKIKRWSKLGNGSEVRYSNKKLQSIILELDSLSF